MESLFKSEKMKVIKNKTGFMSLLFSFVSVLSYSQLAENTGRILNDIKYSEELVVLTDRDIYIAGEKVFFKIYKLNGVTRTPGNMSQVVYSDVLDNDINPLVQLETGIEGLSGSGEFYLPDTIHTGNYLLRSCTGWMQNFPQALYSYKRISVINPFEGMDKIKIPVHGEQPDSIAFYPESGNIVSGVENVIGFRTFDRSGYPTKLNGFIVDSNNDTICAVNTNNEGMGLFSLNPSGSAALYFISGRERYNAKRFVLPVARESGVVMSVKTDCSKDFFNIKIQRKRDYTGPEEKLYFVFNPVLAPSFKKEIEIDDSVDFNINKDSLSAGLAMIMITDNNGLTLAKRWIFNDNTGHISYNVSSQDTVFSTREKVKINIIATGHDGKPVKSDLLVSVVKSFEVDKSNPGNNPQFMQLPFLATMLTDYSNTDINVYLLFYNNEDIITPLTENGHLGNKIRYPELGGHLVTGIIRNKTTDEPLKNESIVLSFVGKKARCRFAKTDENGFFYFNIWVYGTKEVVIQPMSPDLNDYYVELDNPFPETNSRYKPLMFFPDTSRLAEINKAIISMQVKDIYDSYLRKSDLIDTNSVTHDFYGEPVETFMISKYIELTSMKEIVKEIIPGLTVYKIDNKSYFRLSEEYLNPGFNKVPLVLVDGVPIYDIDKILTIDPKELEKIEILHKRYFISGKIIDGIVHFITRKGNLSAFESDRLLFRQEFESLEPVSRFSAPDYSVDSLRNSRIPDFRNTLYLNADLATDENGEASFDFFTSDESGEYIVTVEGFGPDGQSGKSEILLHVRPGDLHP